MSQTQEQSPDCPATNRAATLLEVKTPSSHRPKRATDGGPRWLSTLAAYAAIARPDHWFKNVFMVVGIVLGCFYRPDFLATSNPWVFLLALAATCLVASSNYVINEVLDAPTDRHHPLKCSRPIPSGRVKVGWAYVEWVLLAVAGGAIAAMVNVPFLATAAWLWLMGIVYNVRPMRSKELPYLDVLSEAINNPIRLLLGWFVVDPSQVPPLSLVISYWMVGAFFMATKRFAEYRWLGDPAKAAAYRSSFRGYDEGTLLVSMFFYATAAALFLGVFIIRCHLELILSIPLIAGFFGSYLRVALKPGSSVQAPEKLYKERGLMVYLVICVVVFLGLMFVDIPVLYEWFKAAPPEMRTLWEI
jgi:decaprenyl-phosphate phosphoribosyltransferase